MAAPYAGNSRNPKKQNERTTNFKSLFWIKSHIWRKLFFAIFKAEKRMDGSTAVAANQ